MQPPAPSQSSSWRLQEPRSLPRERRYIQRAIIIVQARAISLSVLRKCAPGTCIWSNVGAIEKIFKLQQRAVLTLESNKMKIVITVESALEACVLRGTTLLYPIS